MPGKGHRAASRQAKLRQRKRRGKGQPEIVAAGPVQPVASESAEESAVELEPRPEPALEARQSSPQPVRRLRQRAPAEPVPIYSYLGPELRQIGLITILIVAILVALTFVLRG